MKPDKIGNSRHKSPSREELRLMYCQQMSRVTRLERGLHQEKERLERLRELMRKEGFEEETKQTKP